MFYEYRYQLSLDDTCIYMILLALQLKITGGMSYNCGVSTSKHALIVWPSAVFQVLTIRNAC